MDAYDYKTISQMPNRQRRQLLKGIVCAVPLVLIGIPEEARAASEKNATSVRVIVPKDFSPPLDKGYLYLLRKATLSYIEEKYRERRLPLWRKKSNEIDLEKRLVNIVYWVEKAVRENLEIYPVDPAWVLAQIMAESYFFEFAISSSLAVGICQFIAPTAKSYDIVYAGSKPEHARGGYQLPELVGRLKAYYQIREARKGYRRGKRRKDGFSIEEALESMSTKCKPADRKRAIRQLAYLKRVQDFTKRIDNCRMDYQKYLEANIQRNGKYKDLFKEVNFFVKFDERFTYRKPIFAMVAMLAKGLRARSGNILASAAGYNAGLSRTAFDEEPYDSYGKIPAINETATYLSRILVNHHEINKRI